MTMPAIQMDDGALSTRRHCAGPRPGALRSRSAASASLAGLTVIATSSLSILLLAVTFAGR